ncbi:MAG: TIGR03545 family protein [Gammaproteobacteria bacterium]|nr:TIGR03545 family protein [Gammaproteobacteria bacterium]
MKNWIRWPGLLAFLLFTVALTGGFYFFAETLLKAAIEHTGTEMVGAKVELDRADLTASPLGVELHNLQVTNPEEPMVNAVQIGRIKLHMHALELLRLKVIVDEMNVEKVRLNTKRTTSGKIAEKPVEEPGSDTNELFDFSMPAVEMPDVKDILAKETLESEKMVEEAQINMDNSKQKWDKKIPELPDKATFDAYAEKLKSITPVKTGNKLKDLEALSNAVDELNTIKKNIQSDLGQLTSAGKELRQDVSLMKNDIQAISQAPSKDIARLMQKYSPSSSGLSNISRLLFGETVTHWSGVAMDWYEKLAPVLLKTTTSEQSEEVQVPRHKGIDIKFKEHNPLPDFLIKSTRVSLELESGNMNGEVKDITSDQQILGRPLTFLFDADKMDNISKLKFSGNFNHIKPDDSIDTVNLDLTGYKVSHFTVSRSQSFPLSLDSAIADIVLSGELKQGNLNANLASQVKSANFVMSLDTSLDTPSDKNTSKLTKIIGDALKNVKTFDVKANLQGTIKDQDIDISSNLDDVVKDAMGEQFKQKAQAFENELKDKVEQKTKGLTAKLESQLEKFNGIQQNMDSKQKSAEENIKSIETKIDSLKNEKGQAVKDKSKDKLKDKLKDRFR